MNYEHLGYPLKFIQKDRRQDSSAHHFTYVYKFYSPVTRYFYIVHADEHAGNFFAIKFYCKKDKRSEKKYSKIVNRGDVLNILITCLKVIPIILSRLPLASFGFVGAPTIDELSNTIESHSRNQRFRIYKNIVEKKIGNTMFAHFGYADISGYLLVNKTAGGVEERRETFIHMLADTYPHLLSVM